MRAKLTETLPRHLAVYGLLDTTVKIVPKLHGRLNLMAWASSTAPAALVEAPSCPATTLVSIAERRNVDQWYIPCLSKALDI
jgi:hypothetical protein